MLKEERKEENGFMGKEYLGSKNEQSLIVRIKSDDLQ